MTASSVDVAQHSAVEIEDYMRLDYEDARVTMNTTILATALELARLHGVRFAASYLCDAGIAIEVAVEVLAHGRRARPLSIKADEIQAPSSKFQPKAVQA